MITSIYSATAIGIRVIVVQNMKMSLSLSFVSALLLAALLRHVNFCYANQAPNYAFLHDATSAPLVAYYDYIIVGGGTAGCPLAATLSQNYSVLVIERGGSPYGNPNITNLASYAVPFNDLSSNSPSQQFISKDGVFNVRPRVLGGGTCLNAGFYSRASEDDVERAGWDRNLVKESFQWVEKLVAFKPSLTQWQSALRDGLLEVGVTPNNGFTYDHIFGTKVGGTIFDHNGHRHTAADLLKYANPKGLTVLLKATLHKILFNTKRKPNPAAHGVIFTDESGVEHQAYLNKGSENEIILSAGALGSPQLLMLSGVGPASHLKSQNISVVLDQPMVGQGMSDNPLNLIYVPSPIDVETSLVQVVGITKYGSYIEELSGRNFLSLIVPQLNSGMLDRQPKGRGSKEMTKGPQKVQSVGGVLKGGYIGEKVTGPLSTGHLELRNKNPHDNPSVTFNYFKDPSDLKACTEGVKIMSKLIESKAFSRYTYPNVSVQALMNMTLSSRLNLRPQHANASFSLEQYCKDTVMTIWHYHGGCQVGKVVDHNYKVLGVNRLRVVDGSTFRFSPGTNPQATVMMLGRYVGVKILKERLK